MNLGVLAVRQLRVVQRHKVLGMAILLPLAVLATWGSFGVPGEYAATTRVLFTPQNPEANPRALPRFAPDDPIYWNLAQQLGVYPGFFREYAIYKVRSHSNVSFAQDTSIGAKELIVTFTDKHPDVASALSFALAKSVTVATAEEWKRQQSSIPSVQQPQAAAPAITTEHVPTREQILLNDALRQDEELHEVLQQKAVEWSQMRHQLSRLSKEEREAMGTQLNMWRAGLEEQIIALQKQILSNQKEEKKLRLDVAKQPPEENTPVPVALPPVEPHAVKGRPFPWTIAVSPNAEIEIVQGSPIRAWPLPAALVLAMLIVFTVDRFDGTLKTESDLQEQLTGSARYLGAVPRIKHETVYR